MKLKIILAAYCLLFGLPVPAQTNSTTSSLAAKTFTFTNKYKEVIHAEAIRFDSKEIVYKEVDNNSNMGRVALSNLPTEFQLQFGYDAEAIRKTREDQQRIAAEEIRKVQEERSKALSKALEEQAKQKAIDDARRAKIAKLRGKSASRDNTPNADISNFKDEALIVSNNGKDTWETITLYINGTPPSGYRITIGPVKPLDSKVVRLREFTKKDGERFNPYAYKVVEVWIGGGGYDYNKYIF